MEVEIIGLNHQGMGIGKIDNKVIFVEHALVGEIVEVDVICEYKKYMVGRVNKIIKKSLDRCNYECKYYDKCGGCNIGILDYHKQLKFKKNKVIDIFRKYGKLEINPVIVETDRIGYRNKIVLHVVNGKLGYFKANTNLLVEINKCIIANDNINKVISIIRSKLDLNLVNKIMIRTSYDNTMVVFYGKIDKGEVINSLSFVDSIYINDKLVYGKERIVEKLGDYKFYISKDSFFQVNTKQTINLYNQVLEYTNISKNDVVMDLYCGTGTIGIFLSKYCKKIIGIEINERAVKDANDNSKLNKVNNIEFICGSSSVIEKLDYKVDVVVVDPPRSGLDKVTIETLNKMKVRKIVYVSCDPMTLVRDIKLLSDNYVLKDIKLFDMFVCDYHVESVVLMEKVVDK